jgi:chemotaxis protein CheD
MAQALLSKTVAPKVPPLAGFESVQRFWDPANESWTAKILPGEFYVTQGAESVTTVLGSCIAACVRDTRLGCGGMNHFMLPEEAAGSNGSWGDAGGASTRYGSFAMESLVNELLKLGTRRERFEFKIFGGGRILPGMTDVGRRNIEFAESFLRLEGFTVAAKDVGDTFPRRVIYFPATGRVLLKRLRSVDNQTLVRREAEYRADLDTRTAGNDVELFD